MSLKDGPGEGTWSVFAEKVAAERNILKTEVERLRDALAAIAAPLTTEDYGNGWAVELARRVLKEKP